MTKTLSAAAKRKKKAARETRHTKLLVAQMESRHLAPQRIIIRNLSPFGLSCRAVNPPMEGDLVTVTLGDFGNYSGKVRWVDGGYFGLQTSTELDIISMVFAKHGFRSADYSLPRDEAFEGLLLFEFYRGDGFANL